MFSPKYPIGVAADTVAFSYAKSMLALPVKLPPKTDASGNALDTVVTFCSATDAFEFSVNVGTLQLVFP